MSLLSFEASQKIFSEKSLKGYNKRFSSSALSLSRNTHLRSFPTFLLLKTDFSFNNSAYLFASNARLFPYMAFIDTPLAPQCHSLQIMPHNICFIVCNWPPTPALMVFTWVTNANRLSTQPISSRSPTCSLQQKVSQFLYSTLLW